MSLETLSAARKNISHDKPLHFVRSLADGQLIFDHCASRKTHVRQNNLLTAVKVLGQACIRQHSAGRIAWPEAIAALVHHRRFGVSDRCARDYLRDLLEAGVLHREADKTLVMVHFAGDMQPFSEEFFERRSAHQRQGSARRSAAHRARRCAATPVVLTDGQKPSPQVAENIDKNDRVTPQSFKPAFNPSHAKTKTKAFASGLTPTATCVRDVYQGLVAASRAKPAATSAFVRTSAPQKAAPKPTKAEIDAVERELLGAVPAKPDAPAKDDWTAMVERLRLAAEAKNAREQAEAGDVAADDAPAEEEAEPSEVPARRPVRQGTPPKSPRSVSQSTAAPASMAQLRMLAETHARHLDGYSINLLALYNEQAPYDLARQAFDITAERLRTCPMGQSKAVREPGAFVLGTMRTLRRMGR